MVNATILEYLKNYKDKYPLGSLKEKILSKGYTETEFNEVLTLLNNSEVEGSKVLKPSIQVFKPKPMPTHLVLERSGVKMPHTGFKWMKTAGIIGMTLLILLLIAVTMAFLELNIKEKILSIGNGGLVGMVAFLSIIVLLYSFGFLKLGVGAESKPLRITSILAIILLTSLFGMIIYLMITFGTTDLYNTINSNNTQPWITTTLGFITLLLTIISLLFSINMIKISREVRFAKTAGIFNMAFSIITIIILGFLVYVVLTNNPRLLDLFYKKEISMTLIILLPLSFLCSRFFESLALISASKEYED